MSGIGSLQGMRRWDSLRRMFFGRVALLLALALAPVAPAVAGPPYETDDPVPTDAGHWEVYAFAGAEGRGSDFGGSAGLDLNFGPVKHVQLTATLPIDYAHDTTGWSSGRGDVELGVKVRFLDLPSKGVSMAVFPRVILPTSTFPGAGNKARILLPVWGQKEWGKTALFGGGGYEINPGPGNRDFWLAGAAITHDFSGIVSLGVDATHQSADAVGGAGTNSLGLGAIVKVGGPLALLAAGGPAWSGGQSSCHAYAALSLNW